MPTCLPIDTLSLLIQEKPDIISFLHEYAPEGTWLLHGQDSTPIWTNLAFWRGLGYAAAPEQAETFWPTLLHPEEVSFWEDQLLKLRTSATGERACHLRLRHRENHWVSVGLRFMRPKLDMPYWLVGLTHDTWPASRSTPNAWEQALSRSHQIYALEINPGGYYTYLNPAFCQAFGINAEDWVGRLALDNILPSYHAACQAAVQRCLSQPGVPVPVLLGKPRIDNLPRLSHWEFTAVADSEGQITSIFALGADLTEHREALQQNAFQAKLLNSVGQAVIATDPLGSIQYWNQAAERLYGWKAAEVLGRSVATVIPRDQTRAQTMAIGQRLTTGEAWRGECSIRDKTGRSFPVEVVKNPVFDEDGQLSIIIEVSHDISERLATQAALAASERKHRLLVDHAPMGIVIHTPDTIEYLNSQAAKVMGDRAGNLLGRSVSEFLVPTEKDDSLAKIQSLFSSPEGAVSVAEETIADVNGQTKHLLISRVKVPLHGQMALCSVFTDITEARQTQAELIRSERKYRFLYDHIRDLICLHDPDGTYREVSPATQRLLGYPPESLVGTDLYHLIHPEDRPFIQREYHQQILQNQAHTRLQYRIRHQDGSYLWFDTFTEPILDPMTGEVAQLMTTSRDITKMKVLTEEKEQLGRLFQAMLSNADDYIFFKDRDHRFITASHSVLALFQLDSVQQLIGKSDHDFMDHAQAERFQQIERQVLAQGEMAQEIHPIVHLGPEEGITYLDNRKFPIRDAEGHIVGLYGIARDITTLKEVEEELIRSTALLRDAQRLARIGSFHADLSTGTWVGSDNFIALFGLPPKPHYSHQEFADLLHPEDKEEVMARFEQSLAQRKDFEYEYRIIHQQTGEVLHVMSRSRITYAADGTPQEIYGVKQDITEQKEAEEAKRLAESLTLKNKQISQFAYLASHDLQEPLRTINSYVMLLQEDYQGQLGEEADLYIRFISGATQRMSQLISGLLDYSRLGKDRVLSLVDCNQLMHQVRADLTALVKQTNARVEIEPLPTLDGYALELRQLFQNLMSNALKFQRPGVPPEIHIGAQATSEGWIFFVRDNGIGINPKYQQKIFQLFQRLHSRSQYEGTGIGLAHCTKIVELHHGRMWVESQPGQGSTFYFTINL